MSVKCPKCEKEISDNAKFCTYCGSAIPEEELKEKVKTEEPKVEEITVQELPKEEKEEPISHVVQSSAPTYSKPKGRLLGIIGYIIIACSVGLLTIYSVSILWGTVDFSIPNFVDIVLESIEGNSGTYTQFEQYMYIGTLGLAVVVAFLCIIGFLCCLVRLPSVVPMVLIAIPIIAVILGKDFIVEFCAEGDYVPSAYGPGVFGMLIGLFLIIIDYVIARSSLINRDRMKDTVKILIITIIIFVSIATGIGFGVFKVKENLEGLVEIVKSDNEQEESIDN